MVGTQKHYPMHGSYLMFTRDRILHSTVCGPWNLEAVQSYARAFKQHADELYGQPWGTLGILQGEPVHTTESKDALVAAIREQRANGRCGTALLLQTDSPQAIIKLLFSNMYAEAGEPVAFFEDEESALGWLAKQIESANARSNAA